MSRWLLLAILVLLYLLRFDFWLWHSPDLVLGLPVGLLYHVTYCLLVATVFALLVRRLWRRHGATG